MGDEQDPADDGRHSQARHMRLVLKAERERRGLSAQQVADLIFARLVEIAEEYGDEESLDRLRKKGRFTGQMVYHWERFGEHGRGGSHPPVDKFAAWARALDQVLLVDLVPKESSDKRIVLLRNPEAIEVARIIDAAPPEKRKALFQIVRAVLSQ